MKKCGKCLEYLEENCFSRHKNGLQSYCKLCQKRYSKKYNRVHIEKIRETLIEWRKHNKSDRRLSNKQKLEESIRRQMRNCFRSSSNKISLKLGYSPKQLRDYFQSKYPDLINNPKSQIGYKKPLKEFNLEKEEEFKKATSLENLCLKLK